MNTEDNYLEVNKHSWNNRVDVHLESDFYDMKGFLEGKTTLQSIELNLLGDVSGKTILHLQCHFGQDTISLSRMGAKSVGIDLSDKAIESARKLAVETNADATFVCCDVYDLPNHLDQKFDMVFTSYGTIGWLPDMDKWAKTVSHFLKPGGKFVFAEFHPVVWIFDDNFEKIGYRYFNSGAIIETESGTYANPEAAIEQQYVCWNHAMSEVVNALIQNGLEINSLNEFDYSPYNCFRNTVEIETGKFRIKHLDDKIPMVYSILATKK